MKVKYSAQRLSTAMYSSRQLSTCPSGSSAPPLNSHKQSPRRTYFCSVFSDGQKRAFFLTSEEQWCGWHKSEFGNTYWWSPCASHTGLEMQISAAASLVWWGRHLCTAQLLLPRESATLEYVLNPQKLNSEQERAWQWADFMGQV